MDILNSLQGVQENVLLSNYVTFKIGGPARYFFAAKNKEEIIEAARAAGENNIPYYIIGGGSNLLVNDAGFNGLVIKIQNTGFQIQDTKIIADAGVSLSKLVIESVNAGLSGLEWAMGVPGTIGGAVYGNAGAYGHSVSESVYKVRTISPQDFLIKEYNFDECGFVYRGSAFKKKDEIIIEVEIELAKGNEEECRKKSREAIEDRRKKTPAYPSAGCVFKNYQLKSESHENDPLVKNFPELAERVKGGKLGVGYLIDKCGLKGKQIGQAKIADTHGNWIVNLGGASSEDVRELISLAKKEVKGKWGIELEEETRFLGF